VAAARAIHELSHDRPKLVPLANMEYRPYIDIFLMPGGIFKKHALYPNAELADDRDWPCYLPIPTPSNAPLQGLAIARACLIHRIRLLKRQLPPDESLWPPERYSAILGPVHAFRRMEEQAGVETGGFLACDCSPDRLSLWHFGYNRNSKTPKAQENRLRDIPLCSRRSRYHFLPIQVIRPRVP
jgi:hypothetical protein